MNDNELKILNYIKDRCKGQQHAETYGHLSLILGIEERELRSTVADLVTVYQVPIGTGQDGYWWLSCDEEYRQAHKELIERMKKLSRRAKGLRLGFERSKQDYKFEQPALLEVAQ